VWIKKTTSAGGSETRNIILIASPAFDRVLAAIRREAEEAGLKTEVSQRRGAQARRAANVTARSQGDLVLDWRLQETPRICRVAIVIDDLGQDLEAARSVIRMPFAVTCAILPWLPYSARIAEEAHRTGREVMVHLPMEPQPGSGRLAEKGELSVGMTRHQVAQVVDAALASVPHAKGVNNHMGSRATTDAALMRTLMRELAKRGLYFIDSRTAPASVAFAEARRHGLPAHFRSVFLDPIPEMDYTLAQMRQLCHTVKEQGAALAIGHPYPTTLAALERFLPEFEKQDIELVPVSRLIQLSEARRSYPHTAIAEN